MTHTELAEIMAVNTDNWTVTVQTKLSEQTMAGVQIAGLYCHVDGGAYMGAVPEEGALCYVMWSDDTPQDRVILNYVMPFSFDEEYRGGRPTKEDISPGDAIIRTNSGAEIIVKQDDSIKITATTGTASRLYDGRLQAIYDVCGTYSMSTGGGYVEWRSNSLLPSAGGLEPITFTLAAKKTKMDLLPIFQIQIGNIEGDAMGIMKVSINPLTDVLESLGVPSSIVGTLYERTISLLGESIEKCISKKIEAQNISLYGSIPGGGFGRVNLGAEVATQQVLKGSALATLLATHVHPGDGAPSPTLGVDAILGQAGSFKVFVE